MTFSKIAESVLLWLVLVGLLGCGISDGGPYESAVWDSAGVTIVETRVDFVNLGTFAVLDPIPVAEIGVESGNLDQEFGRISDARFLGDDRVLIADSQGRVVRVFEYSGELVWSFGRRGEGPWEFRGLTEVEVTEGDSIRIFDRSNRRITVVDAEGQPIRTIPLGEVRGRTAISLQFTGTGSILVPTPAPTDRPPPASDLQLTRDSLVLVLADPEAGELASFGAFLRNEVLQTALREGGMYQVFQMPIEFGRTTEWTSSEDHVFIGTNDSFEFHVFDLLGRLRRVIRVPSLTMPLLEDEVEEHRAFLISERGSTPDAQRQVSEMLSDDFLPSIRPAFSGVAYDDGGRLWIGEYTPRPEKRSVWNVFQDTGELLGAVRLPPGSILHDVAGDLILIQPPHPLDIPIVRVHRLLNG